MQSSNNDKYSEVFIEAKMLSERISQLRRRSIALFYIDVLSLLYLPIYVLMLKFILRVHEYDHFTSVIMWMSILIVIFFIIHLSKSRMIRIIYPLYFDVQRKWNELSDKVDWTTMRKKQLYGELDEKIQKPLDNFTRYRHSLINPVDSGRKMRYIFGLLFFTELFVCPLLTIIMLLY